MRAIDVDKFMEKVRNLPVLTKEALYALADAEPTLADKLLVRQWTEHHKMQDQYGEVQDTVVNCRLYQRNYQCIERYAIAPTFAREVYDTSEFLDSSPLPLSQNQNYLKNRQQKH